MEEALLVRDPPASPGNLCSQEMERAPLSNPSCATHQHSIDREELQSPKYHPVKDLRFLSSRHKFSRNN